MRFHRALDRGNVTEALSAASELEPSEIRARLSELLDQPGTPRAHREWDDHGNHREAELTDLEWWYQSFALLRNTIAHGGDLAAADYLFEDGVPHHWHGEWNLRRAIKQVVANAGHEDVLLDPFERAIRRALG
jgi:hypothetical protein